MRKLRKKIIENQLKDKHAQKLRFMFYGLLAAICVLLCGLLYIGYCRGMAIEGSRWKKDNWYNDTVQNAWDRPYVKNTQKATDVIVDSLIFNRRRYEEIEILKGGKVKRTKH